MGKARAAQGPFVRHYHISSAGGALEERSHSEGQTEDVPRVVHLAEILFFFNLCSHIEVNTATTAGLENHIHHIYHIYRSMCQEFLFVKTIG